jgi:hypothetical protein
MGANVRSGTWNSKVAVLIPIIGTVGNKIEPVRIRKAVEVDPECEETTQYVYANAVAPNHALGAKLFHHAPVHYHKSTYFVCHGNYTTETTRLCSLPGRVNIPRQIDVNRSCGCTDASL